MSEKTIQLLDKIMAWGAVVLVLLLPLFFLPLTPNFYEFNKQALLILATSLLVIVWCLKMVGSKTVKIKISPLHLPVLLFILAYFTSAFWQAANKSETLLEPGSAGTIFVLGVLYFILVNILDKKEEISRLIWAQILSGAVLSLIAIYQFIGVGAALAPTAWLKPQSWTPAGGLLPLTTFLVVSLVLGASTLIKQTKNKLNRSDTSVIFSAISVLLITGALATSIYQLATSAKPVFLPQMAGWQIAVETLKNAPLLGVGPTNFLAAFTQFKPLALNQTPFWASWFISSSNFYFQLLTTVGLLGLGAFLFLLWTVVRTQFKKNANQDNTSFKSVFIALISVFLIMAFLPIHFLLIYVLFILLALFATLSPSRQYEENSRILPWIMTVPIILFTAFSLYFFGRAYLAQYWFQKSLVALSQNRGTDTYNWQIQAIKLNPNDSLLRATYSQTNFALASAIATKSDLADQDRQNISTLIQQAISEAKTAVALNPQNISHWQNLAWTYRSLINFAEGADNWTIATYNQAIALDPYNPNLRLALGGVYYSLSKWDEAIRLFEQTVALKPDFANGYYNLASALREKGDFERAVSAMQQTVSLVKTDSDDWKKATSELEALKKRVAEKAVTKEGEKASGSETLTTPQPLPEGIEPPLALPSEVAPEISPTPSVQPTP